MTTYIDTLCEGIAETRNQTRNHGLERPERIEMLRKITDEYALAHADQFAEERQTAQESGRDFRYRPLDAKLLEQAANLVLYEELTDKSQYKTRDAEYPFLSDLQIARRQTGANERNTGVQKGESPYAAVATFGMDGRDYAPPTRRKRSVYEDLLRDANAQIRNKERRRKYNEFTGKQPVITYYASSPLVN